MDFDSPELGTCPSCGRLWKTVPRSEIGIRFFLTLFPNAEILGKRVRIGSTEYVIRTSRLNLQSDRVQRRWSFSRGSSQDPDAWFWVGLSSEGNAVERAWVVPAEAWDSQVTHVSESPNSQWDRYRCFPSEERSEPVRFNEMRGERQMDVSTRSFVRGKFKRYYVVRGWSVGDLDLYLDGGEYIYYDGYILRRNGDDPDPKNWDDHKNVSMKTMISCIRLGWMVEVPEGVTVDPDQFQYAPPRAQIQLSPADEARAREEGRVDQNNRTVAHLPQVHNREHAQVGTVSGYNQRVDEHNQAAWGNRFSSGGPQHVSGRYPAPPEPQGQVISNSTSGGPVGAPPPPPLGSVNPETGVQVPVGGIPVRVPSKQTADMATGYMGEMYGRSGVTARPPVVGRTSTLEEQGVAGSGTIRDKNGNVIPREEFRGSPVREFEQEGIKFRTEGMGSVGQVPHAQDVPPSASSEDPHPSSSQGTEDPWDGYPGLHPEARKILGDKSADKKFSTKVVVARMLWPDFPDNWPFKGKMDLRMRLTELHVESVPILRAIYAAESVSFQSAMLERWPHIAP